MCFVIIHYCQSFHVYEVVVVLNMQNGTELGLSKNCARMHLACPVGTGDSLDSLEPLQKPYVGVSQFIAPIVVWVSGLNADFTMTKTPFLLRRILQLSFNSA